MAVIYKNAGPEAARIASRNPAMDAAAMRAKAAVLGVIAGHSKTGNYARSVRIREVPGKNGVRDRLVETTDPEALRIEYGHWWKTPEGVVIKWVKGIRIFNRAYDRLG